VRRNLRNGAGLALALFTLTCTDRAPLGPGRHGGAAFDFAALLAHAPGDPPVPTDSVRITVRRLSDDVLLTDTSVALAGFPGTADSAQVTLDIEMNSNTEAVTIAVVVRGNGATWYTGSTTATLTAGQTVRASNLTLAYVGLGFDADSVRIQWTPVPLLGGAFRTASAAVWVPGGILSGVPVGYRIGNTAVASLDNATVNAVRVTGAMPVRDSTWLYAETPTHLKDSIRIVVVPPPAQLLKISGDLQPVVVDVPLGAPLVVRVLDQLGAPFQGASVNWSVLTGTAQLSASTTSTDATGHSSITVTPTAPGPLAIRATVAGLTQTFTGAAPPGRPRS
jgi:hypothetical protein